MSPSSLPGASFTLFVYGTLMRGGRNHPALSGQRFLGTARTRSLYALFDLGPYPGLVHDEQGRSVEGELYEVEARLLAVLDEIEEAPRLFRLEPVEIEGRATPVFAYFYRRITDGAPRAAHGASKGGPMSDHERRIGLIGLGLLGSALAERFLQAGFAVVGYDLDARRRDVLSARGGQPVGTASAAVAERLVLSLPTTDVVETVLAEIRPVLRPGSIVVDTTTGDPDRTAALGAELARAGVRYLDAPVAGSSEQARAGDVVVMVGGERETFDACADLFRCFARACFHLGPWGAGARMKLVVNLVLGLNRAVLAEGLAFARACGLDGAEALKVLQAGAAYSRAMDVKGRKMLDGDFTPQAKLAQHLKDVRLILAQGQRVGAKLPLSTLHRELLERLDCAGLGDVDNSAIIKAFEESPLVKRDDCG